MERDPMEMALSTDIVMDNILCYLKVKDLLACRKVSKFWNQAASSVLRKRSTMIRNISEENNLMELQECMEQSWDFPFAGLTFNKPWKLKSADAMEFFKNYGPRFTRLRLDAPWKIRLQDLAPFINHLQRLSILETAMNHGGPPDAELLDSAAAAGQEDAGILNFPSLRTFRISCQWSEDGLREVCMAASPELRIECLDATYEMLKALKSVGKLQAVSVMHTYGDYDWEKYALRVAQLLSTELPTLKKLDISYGSFLSLDGLEKILISSQHTLKEMCLVGIRPSEFSSEFPVLAKLTKLSLSVLEGSYGYVFQGRQGHKFPALKELIIDTTYDEYETRTGILTDGLFIVPSVTKIDLVSHVDKNGMKKLARSFPNVIEIGLRHDFFDFDHSWCSDPTDIWSVRAFKFLEKLVIRDYTVQCPTKKLNYSDRSINFEKFRGMNMDSFLTGIPITICENLRKHPEQNLVDSRFNQILRDSPSILQLKKLKELIVYVKLQDGLDRLPEQPPFISMVSVWYALQMMPHLEAKFLYDYNSPSLHFKEKQRDKTVRMLKAVFSSVQQYATLEPFFY